MAFSDKLYLGTSGQAPMSNSPNLAMLQIERSEPCLLIRRRTWSEHGLVSVARLIHPGSRNRLEGSFTR